LCASAFQCRRGQASARNGDQDQTDVTVYEYAVSVSGGVAFIGASTWW
jgi:hypothetical protein